MTTGQQLQQTEALRAESEPKRVKVANRSERAVLFRKSLHAIVIAFTSGTSMPEWASGTCGFREMVSLKLVLCRASFLLSLLPQTLRSIMMHRNDS